VGHLSTFQTIATGDLKDVVVSNDGKTAYVSNAEGWVNAFDLTTGDLTGSWKIGTSLGGMDISQDGRYLVATEQTMVTSTTASGYSATLTVHVLDLTSGLTRDYKIDRSDSPQPFYDAVFTSTGKILLSDGGYWRPLTELDPTTGAFQQGQSTYAEDGTLSASRDGSKIIFTPSNISDMPIFVYEAGKGVTASHENYQDGVDGYNSGFQAISPSGDLIIQHGNIYDGALKFKGRLGAFQNEQIYATGMAFSSDGQSLYVLDNYTAQILQLSTTDWSIQKAFASGLAQNPYSWSLVAGGAYGDRLTVSADGKSLVVLGDKSLNVIDLTTVSASGGSDKADTLTGDASGNTIRGYGGNDLIDGGAGADTLLGGAGDDTLIGGLGNDKLDGGLGADTVSYASAAVGVVVELGATYGQTASGVGYDSLDSIENVTGSAFADRLIGDRFANVLAGGDGGDSLLGGGSADTLLGGAGSDVLQGQDGDDVLDGGNGIDFASYENAAAAVIVDLSASTVQNTRGDGLDLLRNIEGLIGSRFGDKLTGSSAGDILSGGEGGDTLIGGLGADVLSGDAGDDVLDGGAGDDLASYATAGIGVNVDLGFIGAQDTQGVGLDTLLSIEGLIGSRFGDTLKGGIGGDTIVSGGGSDFADGGQGADLLQGDEGQDTLWGGEGNDSVEGGADFDQINGNMGDDIAYGGEGGDWVVGGKDNDLLYGENGDDIVYGNLGNDTCYGGEGADLVRGGQGDDLIDGGAGNDWMSGDRGNDTVTGGAGADKFFFFAGAAIDRVTDFSSAAGDRVLLDAGQAYALSYTAEGAVIDLGNGDQMILVGVTQASLGDWLVI